MSASTQHGVTLVFAAPLAFTGELTILGANEQTREAVEDTHHGTTGGRTWIQEALTNFGSFDFEYHFDTVNDFPDISAGPAQATITFVITEPPNASEATIIGTGFFTNVSSPEVQAGATETAKISGTFTWDGKTPPAFVKEAV